MALDETGHNKEYPHTERNIRSGERGNNHEEREISAKITPGNRKYELLRALMSFKYHSRCMKMRICNTIMKATTMHESETLVQTKKKKNWSVGSNNIVNQNT